MFWNGVTMNPWNRYVEDQSCRLGLNADGGKDWEEVAVPTSARAWADLFDDRSSMPFQEQL